MKVTVTLADPCRQWTFVPDGCDYDRPWDALRMWTEGNFGCDCNMSLFIQRQCHNGFHLRDCGDTITLVSIVAEDGTRVYPELLPYEQAADAKGEWTWDSLGVARLMPPPLVFDLNPNGLYLMRDAR